MRRNRLPLREARMKKTSVTIVCILMVRMVNLQSTLSIAEETNEMVIQRDLDLPRWATKSAWKDENYLNVIGISSGSHSLEHARAMAFSNGKKEVENFSKQIDLNLVKIESVEIWDVKNEDNTYTVYRWLRVHKKEIVKSYTWHYLTGSVLTITGLGSIVFGSYVRFYSNEDLYNQYQASTDVNEITKIRNVISDNNLLITMSILGGLLVSGAGITYLVYTIKASHTKVSLTINPLTQGTYIGFNL